MKSTNVANMTGDGGVRPTVLQGKSTSIPEGEIAKYDYTCLEGQFILSESGRLFRITDACQEVPWFKNSVSSKPWIPAKRRSFVSLIKQSIRDNDFQ